ncbi:MAG: amidohydrolase family protein [Chloroflexota bacterium]
MYDFSEIPVIDNHCHPYLFELNPERYEPLDTFVGTRDGSPESIAHRDAMIYQRWATRELAKFLGCEPTAAAVARARAAVGDEGEYVKRLFASEGVQGLVIDTGYPQPPVDMTEFRRRVPTTLYPVYRIEPPIKALLDRRVSDFGEFVRAFEGGIRRALGEEGFIAVKSIIAYRTGLDLDLANEPDEMGARGLALALAEPDRMMASKMLRDHLIFRTLRLCRDLGVSFHIHTGIGDPDIVLARCNPALLNETLKQPQYRETRVVLIHTYPYVEEASWMASALPNVWMDLSEGVPFAVVATDRIFEKALDLAPFNRIFFGSDAFSGPEQTWLAAKVSRQALARVLGTLHARGYITEAEGPEIAEAILIGNARRMYGA